MLTDLEFNVIVSVLQRAPVLAAEQIVLPQILEKIKPQQPAQPQPEDAKA